MKKQENKTLIMSFVVLISVIAVIGIIGYFILTPDDIIIQGEIEATEVRVSGKLPGRVLEIRYKEGMSVKKGDTLILIDSPEINAKVMQAEAAESAAAAVSLKAQNGTRKETIEAAAEQYEMAKAAADFAKKSYDRTKNLYDKGVIAAQKYDEVKAKYDAAKAQEKAAKSQYDMALNGAQKEDKMAALAQVQRAKGAVNEATSYLNETKLVAPISGEIAEIFPKVGELVGSGSPLMNIVDLSDIWVTFNLKENLLSKIKVGDKLRAKVPALNDKEITLKVTYIKVLGSYAPWKATKLTDEYDTKTFEVRAVPLDQNADFRPGMSVIINWSELK